MSIFAVWNAPQTKLWQHWIMQHIFYFFSMVYCSASTSSIQLPDYCIWNDDSNRNNVSLLLIWQQPNSLSGICFGFCFMWVFKKCVGSKKLIFKKLTNFNCWVFFILSCNSLYLFEFCSHIQHDRSYIVWDGKYRQNMDA